MLRRTHIIVSVEFFIAQVQFRFVLMLHVIHWKTVRYEKETPDTSL